MASKFELFSRTDLVYKTIGDTPFVASVLIPKGAIGGNRPLLVHFHGGGLMVGDRMYEDWYPRWLLQYAESEGAVVVTPDYRKIPEANGVDILNDVEDFWSWVRDTLPAKISEISPGMSLDLSRVAAAGESAGGYLSLESAFLFPEAGIKLVMAQYPTIDLSHPAYNPPPAQQVPPEKSVVDKFVRGLAPGAIRLSSLPPDHWELFGAIIAEGRHRELIGSDERLLLLKSLEAAQNPPATWIAQGESDFIIPKVVTDNFVKEAKRIHPATPIHYSVQPGSHGFDVESTMDDPWVQEGINFAKKYW